MPLKGCTRHLIALKSSFIRIIIFPKIIKHSEDSSLFLDNTFYSTLHSVVFLYGSIMVGNIFVSKSLTDIAPEALWTQELPPAFASETYDRTEASF
ncbi:hypothetical protein HK16_19825 [Acetobacter senegalensis]|uniref:Uncharacterized protein n=2 Tax=Acetobacter TaxID=434 RepID=A0A149U7N0_9PROT|nr:hypothetical protein CIW82_16945 [Acetobacter tropicalis]KXV61448.1 hypothetical protein AD948_01725 [Acetobacter senegalensis]OUL64977.1 hypothetical protein HK16_19825 [Acetobacter senegalensis]